MRLRRASSVVSVVLLFLLAASASPALAAVFPWPGSQVFAAATPIVSYTRECPDSSCASVQTTWTNTATTGTYRYFMVLTTRDPRTFPEWPNAMTGVTAVDGQTGNLATSSAVGPGVSSGPSPSIPATTANYVTIYSGTSTTATASRVPQFVWELHAPPAPTTAPTTSAPATTTAPPSSSGATTTAPATSSPPSTGGTGTISCVEATPCFVKVVSAPPATVDVGSIDVQALTDEQWSNIELGLAALVFFAAGSFVASWRHGRGA
jgi:hypothetical protein